MTWLSAHMTQILTYWGIVWVLATMLQNVFPQGSAAWKTCHAVLALSPLDFVKGFKALGTSLVPPVAAMLLLLVASTSACSHNPAPKTADQARQEARAATVTVEQAWMGLAHACVDAAATTNDTQLLGECAAVLDPIRVSLEAADDTINAWTDATSNAPLACKLAKAAADLQEASLALGAPPAVKVAISDAVSIVDALGGCSVDGGK